jgi:hypothetical protein
MSTPIVGLHEFRRARVRPQRGHRMSGRLALLFAALLCGLRQISAPASDPKATAEQVQQPTAAARESADEARRRHERVAERRQGLEILCHRGALEFAQENTLEAYRATLELGGDGNEIDIRQTKDGVLVCFHDDMLDRLLEAYGTVPEVTWAELQRFRFRDPGAFKDQCRVPRLVEVLELHRQHAGLLHLDIKESGLDQDIAKLLDQFDMWDHVAHCNPENAAAIVGSSKLRLDRYKGGLYLDRGEVDPLIIAQMLKRPGNAIIVEDPRGVLVALGRRIGSVSREPVAPVGVRSLTPKAATPVAELIEIMRDANDWNHVAESAAEQARSGERIRARALAAEQLLAAQISSAEAFAVLEARVRHRSLHKEWMYHGFDGAMALRTLILLRAPKAVELARATMWLDDPELAPVVNPRWNNPRSWTDFRVKMIIFPALEKLPGAATEQLCRDYLALSDAAAREIGPPQFEAAARTLLAVDPTTATALELIQHRLPEVRGRAILDCVRHANRSWARSALDQAAPHALRYEVADD